LIIFNTSAAVMLMRILLGYRVRQAMVVRARGRE
jgi:hypothetical protein